ncbi:hypothetical protein JCM18899A_17790 [Nocardioides sp. AN3]
MSISEPLAPPPDGGPDHASERDLEAGLDRNANRLPDHEPRPQGDAKRGSECDDERADDRDGDGVRDWDADGGRDNGDVAEAEAAEGASPLPNDMDWPVPSDENAPPPSNEDPPPPEECPPPPPDEEGGSWDSSGELLEAFTAAQRREAREQVRKLQVAVDYCAFNSHDSRHPAARLPGTEGTMALAGDGAPEVAEFAVVEFGAVAGMSTDAARLYLGRCLEVAHRLPFTWHAVRTGRLPVWRALRIAEHTMTLPPHVAAHVDAAVARIAGRVGPVVLKRMVEEALAALDPDATKKAEAQAAEKRHATITHEKAGDQHGAATVTIGRLDAVLDPADALDLDATLADYAADLATAGDTRTLDVRRSTALGMLARGETVDLPEGAEPRRRQVVLHIHLAQAALTGTGHSNGCVGPGNGRDADADELIGMLHSHTGYPLGMVTVDQVRDWCGSTSTGQIIVKPVLDLAETLRSTGYEPSDRVRDHVFATNPTCVFPFCDRPSLKLDIDHIEPYDEKKRTRDKLDERGRPGKAAEPDKPGTPDDTEAQTTTDNLAPLCRRHHRVKTFGNWSYLRLGPGEYLWTSRYRYQWITDADGTRRVESQPPKDDRPDPGRPSAP